MRKESDVDHDGSYSDAGISRGFRKNRIESMRSDARIAETNFISL